MIDGPFVLDTSIALNLLAAEVGVPVIESIGVPCFMASASVGETIYIRSADPNRPPEPVSVDSWLTRGCVQIVEPENRLEEEIYVRFAVDLDDGEAMSLAICRARGFALATDDRKARRIASQLPSPGVALISTSEMVNHWANKTGAERDRLRRTLKAIEQRARFIPPHDDPLRDWWIYSRSESPSGET